MQSTHLDGLMIYTTGKLPEEARVDRHYFLVPSKKAF